jgi:hypothetical protein
MARFDTYVCLPAHVVALLGDAAVETGVPIGQLASLACQAAARLAMLDPHTTAMPRVRTPNPRDAQMPYADVSVSLNETTLRTIVEAADRNGMSLPSQLRGVLSAAVHGYTPERAMEPRPRAPLSQRQAAQVAARVEAAKPRPKAMPTRKAFDPSYYAKRAIIPDMPKGTPPSRAEITAAAFGDPRRAL